MALASTVLGISLKDGFVCAVSTSALTSIDPSALFTLVVLQAGSGLWPCKLIGTEGGVGPGTFHNYITY